VHFPQVNLKQLTRRRQAGAGNEERYQATLRTCCGSARDTVQSSNAAGFG
jgi:hypothetical protein